MVRLDREGQGRTEAPSQNGQLEHDDFGLNAVLVDEIYDSYRVDPLSVDPAWVEVFGGEVPVDDLSPLGDPVESNLGNEPEKGPPLNLFNRTRSAILSYLQNCK